MTLFHHLKRNNQRYLKPALVTVSILFIFGLYKTNVGISLDREDKSELSQLIAKRSTDAGEKCDVTRLNLKRSKDLRNHETTHTFLRKDLYRKETYDKNRHVLAFLHIQKTGGSELASFANRITQNLTSNHSPLKHINSNNAMFYLLCGLHNDWRAIHGCVQQMFKNSKTLESAMVTTMIRDPKDRYLSEWLHIQRGSTWVPSAIQCSTTDIPRMEPIPKCIPESKQQPGNMFPIPQSDGKGILSMAGGNFQRWSAGSSQYTRWEGVSLQEFMGCPNNPATNRMVSMLADHTVLGDHCNGTTVSLEERSKRLLESAKNNLKNLAFFGLAEHQSETEALLKKMLGIQDGVKLKQREINHVSCVQLTKAQQTSISQLNHLDEQLYKFAKDLFYERLKANKLI